MKIFLLAFGFLSLSAHAQTPEFWKYRLVCNTYFEHSSVTLHEANSVITADVEAEEDSIEDYRLAKFENVGNLGNYEQKASCRVKEDKLICSSWGGTMTMDLSKLNVENKDGYKIYSYLGKMDRHHHSLLLGEYTDTYPMMCTVKHRF